VEYLGFYDIAQRTWCDYVMADKVVVIVSMLRAHDTSQTWKAMEGNCFPHVFCKKKGSHF
jgi:hypothetical protein